MKLKKSVITLLGLAGLFSFAGSRDAVGGWSSGSDESGDVPVCRVTSSLDSLSNANSLRRKVEKGFNIADDSGTKFCNEKIIIETNINLTEPLVIKNRGDSDGVIIEGQAGKVITINASEVGRGCAVTVASDKITFKNIIIANAQGTGLCVESSSNTVTGTTTEYNGTGLLVSGTGNKITGNVFRYNEGNGVELQEYTGNEVTENSYYGNDGLPLSSPYETITPTIESAIESSNSSNYQVYISVPADVEKVELYRFYPRSGEETYIGAVTQFTSRSATYTFSAVSGESVFAIAFLNDSTSSISNVMELSQYGNGSGSDCADGPVASGTILNRNCAEGAGSPELQDTDCDGIYDNDEDLNLNCRWDAASGETDAEDSDSDGDGLYDSQEDSDRDGLWDEGSETNPLDEDTDGDQIPDGAEDFNQNGVKNSSEADPLKTDTDGDGLLDNLEDKNYNGEYDSTANETKAYHSDTDSDGLADGIEDSNQNGQIDAGESDPRKMDSDSDGLPDGSDDCPMNPDVACINPCIPGELPAETLDSDFDGLPDFYEDFNHDCELGGSETDPLESDTDADGESDRFDPCPRNSDLNCTEACVSGAVIAPQYDADSDGLTNVDEDENENCITEGTETDAFDADTDDDGIQDGIEAGAGMSPIVADSDQDGLVDGDEDINGDGIVQSGESSPLKADTDGDGTNDYQDPCPTSSDSSCEDECVPGQEPPPTRDSDSDGIPNVLEDIDFDCFEDFGETDPFNSDTDGDALADGIEDADSNGELTVGETDPRNADTDADGIEDGSEDANQNGRSDFGECDPLLADTDNDGLADYLEDQNRNGLVDDGETSCSLTDSDFDGFADGTEDANLNGSWDAGETDPAAQDTDGDGAIDGSDPNATLSREEDYNAVAGINSGCSLNPELAHQPSSSAIFLLLLGIYLAVRKPFRILIR